MSQNTVRERYVLWLWQKQIASLPQGVTWGITGPYLTSFMSHLVAKYKLSRRELQEFLKEHYDFHLSLGMYLRSKS